MAEGRFRIVFAPAARRDLASLPAQQQQRIGLAVDRLEANPRPPGALPLAGRSRQRQWRIRVGDYRVIYEIQDEWLLVLVIRLGHRGDVYRLR